MAGHSHWKNVKRTKEADSKKRATDFSKLVKKILLAVKDGGKDPESNPSLRLAVERARKMNMPKENIERAIKRGTGETKEGSLEEFIFEAFSADDIALIVEGITDNIKRAISEFKAILSRHKGKFAEAGAVRWLFDHKGFIVAKSLEKEEAAAELLIIDSGADDFFKEENVFYIYTKPGEVEKVKKNLESAGVLIEKSSLVWLPKETVKVEDKERHERIISALEDNEDIQEIYTNAAL